jgi:hypothetical protein
MRFPAAYGDEVTRLCEIPYVGNPLPADTETISGALNALNSQLYCFVTGLNTEGESCQVTLADTGFHPEKSIHGGPGGVQPTKKSTERPVDKR